MPVSAPIAAIVPITISHAATTPAPGSDEMTRVKPTTNPAKTV